MPMSDDFTVWLNKQDPDKPDPNAFFANTTTMWVAHSPYPNQTWRGLEKCSAYPVGDALLLFHDKDACAAYIARMDMDKYMLPVAVQLTYPLVGTPLTAVQGTDSL